MLKTARDEFEQIWAFSKARDLTKELFGNTVIAFPRGRRLLPGKQYPDVDRIKELMQEIFDASGVIVVPAGNGAKDPERTMVDGVPALWARSDFPLIVVGAVDNDGNRAPFSQGGNKVSIHAPKVRLSCPHDDERQFSGTSYVAPMVSLQLRRIFTGVEINICVRLLDSWPTISHCLNPRSSQMRVQPITS